MPSIVKKYESEIAKPRTGGTKVGGGGKPNITKIYKGPKGPGTRKGGKK